MPNLITQLRDKYETLPDELKDAIYSVPLHKKFLHTLHVYGLDNQAPLIGDLIGMRMLGVLPEEKYKGYLREGAKTTEKFDELYERLEDEMFRPLRPHLRRLYGEAPPKKTLVKEAPPGKPTMASQKSWEMFIPPPPLDLRKIQREREREATPPPEEHEFPGEIVHHGGEEKGAYEEFVPFARGESSKKETGAKETPRSQEPFKRHAPPEKDTYLEPVGEKEGKTINLSKEQ